MKNKIRLTKLKRIIKELKKLNFEEQRELAYWIYRNIAHDIYLSIETKDNKGRRRRVVRW